MLGAQYVGRWDWGGKKSQFRMLKGMYHQMVVSVYVLALMQCMVIKHTVMFCDGFII